MNRSTLAIGTIYLLTGLGLWWLVWRATWSFSIVAGQGEWYHSDWLPIIVAALLFLATASRLRLRQSAVLGLLVTAPPYGWLLRLVLSAASDSADPAAAENARALVPLLGALAISGGILCPLIGSLIGRMTRGTVTSEA